MGLINAKTAFLAYIVLAGSAFITLDGNSRFVALAVLAVFALRTYVEIVRRRIAEREAAEAPASTTATPASDVLPGHDS